MPQPTKNAPDLIDLENLLGVLGESYHVVVYFTTRIRGGKVELIGKTHSAPYTQEGTVEHVAMVTYKAVGSPDMAVKMYTIAFDLWCQHDGGGATAARRGAPHAWTGRVEVPRARKLR